MKRCKTLLALSLIITVVTALVQVIPAQEAEKININQASLDELTQLKGIGSKLAVRIIQYREEHGLFESSEDIMKVKGIGPKTWEKNRDRITVKPDDNNGETGQ